MNTVSGGTAVSTYTQNRLENRFSHAYTTPEAHTSQDQARRLSRKSWAFSAVQCSGAHGPNAPVCPISPGAHPETSTILIYYPHLSTVLPPFVHMRVWCGQHSLDLQSTRSKTQCGDVFGLCLGCVACHAEARGWVAVLSRRLTYRDGRSVSRRISTFWFVIAGTLPALCSVLSGICVQ